MAKILSFRNKDGSSSDQDFLADGNETLSFRTSENGAVSLGEMSFTSLPSPLPDPQKDWANQELADLFRVRHLLGCAGVPVETMRGVTDEGDPWFVYCHLNGDVFIHMARIDGDYVLDSPNVHRPLRGRDFNELIADFTSDALPSYAHAGSEDDNTERRVIKLERGGNIRLHPSAMLAALIWTLFLASEELIMLVPKEQDTDSDDLLDFTDVITADLNHQTFEIDTTDLGSLSVPEVVKELQEDLLHNTPEAQVQIRETMAQQGLAMHQNAFAMGLSTIAIAMGFMSETALHNNQRNILEGLNKIGLGEYATGSEAGPDVEQVTNESNDALLEMLAEFLGLDLSLNTEIATAPINGENEELTEQDMVHLAGVVDEIAPVVPKTTQTVVNKNDDMGEAIEAAIELSDVATEPQETLVAMSIAEQDAKTLTMSEILNGKHQMQEFQLGQTTIMASFDVTKSDTFSLSDYLFFDMRTTDHRAFDDHAQSFIDYIQAKETEVGVIKIGNEVVMLDRGAFLDRHAETYTFTWETYDGQIISMIGLKADFQQFDLIA